MNANWSKLYFLNLVALFSNKSSSQEWKAFQLAISHVNSNKSLLPNTTVKAFEGDMDEENILEYGECLTCGLNNSCSVINLLTDTSTIIWIWTMEYMFPSSGTSAEKGLLLGVLPITRIGIANLWMTHLETRTGNPRSLDSVLSWNVGIWISLWCQSNKTYNILLTKITKNFISSRG